MQNGKKDEAETIGKSKSLRNKGLRRIRKLFQKKTGRSEFPKRRREPYRTIAFIFLCFGIIAVGSAIYFGSSILAFVGLGLTLWGGLFFFISPEKYVRLDVSESTALSSLVAIDRLLTEFNFQGQGIYLPPRQLKEFKEGVVFVPNEKVAKMPSLLSGICLLPPGQDLLNLYEKELKTNLSKTNLNYIINNFPKLLIEDLEMIEEFEISQKEDNVIYVKMKGPIYGTLCSYLKNYTKICSRLGCPLCSSIACALARATDKAVTIEKDEVATNGKTIETWFRIIES